MRFQVAALERSDKVLLKNNLAFFTLKFEKIDFPLGKVFNFYY
jgi:hypothetical protein